MKYKHECLFCKEEFESNRSHSRYCSDLCGKKWNYRNNPKTYNKECKNCGEAYETKSKRAKFCSDSCVYEMRTKEAKEREVEKTCPTCSNTWVVPYHERSKTKYCSYSCATTARWQNWEEQDMKEEIGNRISEALIEGYSSGRIERKFGEKSSGWKGGITKIAQGIRGMSQYTEWRMSVFERDRFTCCFCNKSGGYLNADHIKPLYQIMKENNIKTTKQAVGCKELWNTDNGRTLCVPCHKKTETYGRPAKK